MADPQILAILQDYFERYREVPPLFALGTEGTVDGLDLPPVGPGFSQWQRLQGLRQLTDPRFRISSWISLAARLMGLGWVGPAFGARHLRLAGGLVGCHPLIRVETAASFVEARERLEASLQDLVSGVGHFLSGTSHSGSAEGPLDSALRQEFWRCCGLELQAGHLLPPPLVQAAAERPAFDRWLDEVRLA
jgi:hypothetical protein